MANDGDAPLTNELEPIEIMLQKTCNVIGSVEGLIFDDLDKALHQIERAKTLLGDVEDALRHK